MVLHSGRGARGGRPAVRPTTTRAVVAGGGGAHCTHSRRACVGRPWRARSTRDDSACGQLATSYSTSTLSERANAYICTYVSSVTLASTPRAPQYACTGCTGARRPGANIASHTCSLASEPCTRRSRQRLQLQLLYTSSLLQLQAIAACMRHAGRPASCHRSSVPIYREL